MNKGIAVFGTGYVGLVQGLALNHIGNRVYLVDIDNNKIDMIKNRKSPIFEEGIDGMLSKYSSETLIPTTNASMALDNTDIIFVCVGTPNHNGRQDTRYIENACRTIGRHLKDSDFKIIVVKSTVYPGLTNGLIRRVLEEESGKKAGIDFGLAMNPEFLRQGTALSDFYNVERNVIGVEDDRSKRALLELYSFISDKNVICRISEAELIKYAANSFLAVKISYANEIGNLCKRIGVDSHKVLSIVGKDSRIGEKFLESGIGYGGSCFPKDVSALESYFRERDVACNVISAAKKTNKEQPHKIIQIMGEDHDINGKNIGILGLSFKPGTDDVRESPAIPIIESILKLGGNINAHDPAAMNNMKRLFPKINYYTNPQETISSSDIILVLSNWKDYETLNYRGKPVYMGRRLSRVEGIGIAW